MDRKARIMAKLTPKVKHLGFNRKELKDLASKIDGAAALAMAKDGLIVKLTPEGKIEFSTGIGRKGDPVYADGLVNGQSYEQQTKNPRSSSFENLKNAVDGALQHARDKHASIPLIYDKYGKFHREHIEAGLAQFEQYAPDYRFKAIFVVDKHGNLWEHQHNQ